MPKLSVPVNNQTDHIQGAENAPVQLVEYGDYQCPYCGSAYVVIKELQAQLGDKLSFVFRNFPLTEIHQHALPAALAAEAAGKQGKFWDMHDVLYENQNYLGNAALLEYAEQLGLDRQQFENDFSSQACMDKVQADFESGVRSGVNGTPSLYINGQKYQGEVELGALAQYILNH